MFDTCLRDVQSAPEFFKPALRKTQRTHPAETILVVEDEPYVREFVSEVLQKEKYDVLSASGLYDALLKITCAEGRIDLIVTDVMMPFGNGPELVTRVRELHPAARVLYMSGYVDETEVRQGEWEPRMAFLPKPFAAEALVRKVRRLLTFES
jgi:DNA-binding NtrC family response regulator